MLSGAGRPIPNPDPDMEHNMAPRKSVVTEDYPTVKVGGKSYTLVPTLKAVRGVCAYFGGILPAYQQVNQVNPSASAAIIAIGSDLDLKDQDTIDAFEEKVWTTERGDYRDGVVKFLGMLLNGGKEIEEKEEGEPKKEADTGNG